MTATPARTAPRLLPLWLLLALCVLLPGTPARAQSGNAAAFVSQSVPPAMTAGQSYPVTVTMQNTGTTTWTGAGAYHLGSQSPQDNLTWGANRQYLPVGASVAPGQSVTFSFTVTAPSAPGTYPFQWRMVQDGVQWFGDFTPAQNITVSAASPDFALTLGQSALTVAQGDSRGVPVTVTPSGGFTGPVSLSASAPAAASLQTAFVPASLAGGGASRLIVTVSPQSAPGTYPLLVAATSGAVTRRQTLTLTVTATDYTRPQLTLTDAGRAAGFGLTTFATGFPDYGIDPMGIAFPGTGVLVSDFDAGDVRLFPTDADGQVAGAATAAKDSMGVPISYSRPSGLATSNGQTYLCEFGNGDILRLDANGSSLGQVATGVGNPLGIIPDPLNGHLFVTDYDTDTIYDVDPTASAASAASVWLPNLNDLDGLTISGDGSVLYSLNDDDDIIGYDTTTKATVFDLAALNPVAPVVLADGTAIGSGTLAGKLYVNCNNGVVWQVDMTTGDCVQIATATPYGLTRGDFATPDPNNGSLLLTQSDSIMRLTSPAGGRFGQTPPAPLGLRATPGNGQISLAWDPVPGATAYALSRATVSGGPYQPVATNITALTYTDAGLVNGQTYFYVVGAANSFGAGPTSNEASAAPSGNLPLPVNAAAFVSQSVPATMSAGQTCPVTVTLRNAGTSVWTAAGAYRLGSQSPQDSLTWGLGRVELPGSSSGVPGPVQPGATAAFTFTVTAPSAPGSYAFQWRMVQDGVQWFGDFTPQVAVTVTPAAPPLDAPADLSAYATGDGRVALYWTQVPGAAGYNVYRGTSAGGEDYAHPVNGDAPVNTPSYPGSPMDLFTDTGLMDGTEYFYTIEAVTGSASSLPSPEDSDAPDPTAIPWDGTPAAILTAIRQQESGQPGLLFSQSDAALRVVGPDGAVYQEGDPDRLPPDGGIDAEDGTMTLNGITTPTHFADEQSGQGGQSGGSGDPASASDLLSSFGLLPLVDKPKTTVGGGIRRVTSTPGISGVLLDGGTVTIPFDGVEETVYLPSTSDSSSIYVAPAQGGVSEGPQNYIGMTSKSGVEVDAGVQLNPPTVLHNLDGTDTPLPQRWSTFMRLSDGRTKANPDGTYTDPRTNPGGYLKLDQYRILGDPDPYIVAASDIGNDAILNLAIDPKHNLCSFVVEVYDDNGLDSVQWYVAAVGGITLYPTPDKPMAGIRMKRETSLDQNIPVGDRRIVPFSNAPRGSSTSKPPYTLGYIPTGSYMRDIIWQDGLLFANGGQYDWIDQYQTHYPNSLNTLLYSYYSMIGATQDVVTTKPQPVDQFNQEDKTGEIVNIQH